MPRIKAADRPVEWRISVPESVVLTTEIMLVDPTTGRVKHGARSKLITQLLREHFKMNGNEEI